MDQADAMNTPAKKRVILRAPVLSQSGYGVHSRQVARWLLSRSDIDLTIQPVQWGITPWYIDAAAQDGFIGQLMERCRDDKGPFDVSFQVQLPNEWTVGLAAKDVGITAGVETTICNPDWVKCVNAMAEVIVPSSFVKSTFEKSGTLRSPSHVRVIPESYIDGVASDDVRPLDLGLETGFNFLMVGQLTSRAPEAERKNTFNAIKWFCETFEGDSDVGLILKTNMGRETKIDRKVTSDTLRAVLAQVRKGRFPRVHLIHGALRDDEMAGLYRHPSIRAFVSLTRGEGFGLPILEAAVTGLPVIATGWSGHLDFMGLGKFIKIDFELKQIPKSRIDKSIFVPEAKWAEVLEQDVKRKLRRLRERPETPTEWARQLAPVLKDAFSFSAVSKQYDAIWERLAT